MRFVSLQTDPLPAPTFLLPFGGFRAKLRAHKIADPGGWLIISKEGSQPGVIEVTNLVKRYGKNTVLNQATFTIQEGQLTTILGPSGCGKSTMLRCMNRLERFDRGSLKIGDVEVLGTEQKQLSTAEEKDLTRRLRERVGIIFQNFNLFPHLTVLGNAIEAPMTVKGHGTQPGHRPRAPVSEQGWPE